MFGIPFKTVVLLMSSAKRCRLVLLIVLGGIAGCGNEAEPEPPAPARPRGSEPKIIRHKVNQFPMMNPVAKPGASAFLEVEVANDGGAGSIRIRADQGDKSWERQEQFAEGEQRTVFLNLPGAGQGHLMVTAQGDPVRLANPPVAKPKPPGFWAEKLETLGWIAIEVFATALFLGAATLFAAGLTRVFGPYRKSKPSSNLPEEPATINLVCSICGNLLKKPNMPVAICATCRKKSILGE